MSTITKNKKRENRTLRTSKYRLGIPALFVLLVAACIPVALAQTADQGTNEDVKKNAPRVFLKSSLDPGFFQKEITFIHFVPDEAEAQVLVEITSHTSDRGEEFILSFEGRKEFAGVNDVLKYAAEPSQKPETAKQEVARTLKMGLLRYVSKTPISSRVNIAFVDQVKPTAVLDKWDFWVFSLSVNGMLNGEKSYKSQMWFGSFSASRVTEDWKIRLSCSGAYQKNSFTFEDYSYESSTDSQSFRGLVVRSLDNHWSIGAFLTVGASTYNNMKFGLVPTPAIEYDLFPYSESTKQQLRFLYFLGPNFVRYREETIYDKIREILWGQSLSATLELKQPWGTISMSLEGSHYFHDIKKNRLELDGEISLRIFKGLNFNISGGGARIHDQLSLPKAGATIEEVLLRRRQLETNYNYFFSIGLSYTFGSIRSNVVNPRFGSGSGGVSISISM